jgi:cation transport ATPase
MALIIYSQDCALITGEGKTVNYVHHIPGRLRVRSCALKQVNMALAIENSLSSLSGVEEVRTNLVTGSATVRYRPALIAGEEVLRTICAVAGTSAEKQNAASPAVPSPPRAERTRSGSNAVAKRVFNQALRAAGIYLLEQAVERSVAGLIVALL